MRDRDSLWSTELLDWLLHRWALTERGANEMSTMTAKELRVELDILIVEMGVIQTKVNELAAKLIVATKEEMKR